MNRKSLFVSIVLALLIAVIPISAFAAPTDGLNNFKATKTYVNGQFSDVQENQWYYGSVKSAYEYGLIMGNGNGKFNVTGNITIAETLALACRLNNIYHGGDGNFEQSGIWYQVYVDYAMANGIITEGQFSSYTASATRAQFVQILSKAFPDSAFSRINDVSSIPDVAGSDSYYADVIKLYQAGILTGSDKKGTFNPQSNIVRTEVAAIITRMADPSLRVKMEAPPVQNNPQMTIHFIDVGQGDSTLIDFGNTEILIDAGNTAYGSTVSSYISNYVDGDIELVIGTHLDADHIGGMTTILQNYNCSMIMDSGEKNKGTIAANKFIEAAANEGTTYVGDYDVTYNLGYGASLRIIETGDNHLDNNDDSVVCLLKYGDFSAIFTGDMSSAAEKDNLSKFSDVTVLKVGHHGSGGSSSQAFLNVTKPDVAVISAAKNNDYGHPHLETIQRLESIGAKIYGTFKSGTVIVTTDGSAYSVNTNTRVTAADAGSSLSSGTGTGTNPPGGSSQESGTVNPGTNPGTGAGNTAAKYIGNRNSMIFHFADCYYVSKMSEGNKVAISDRNAAVSSGYAPCKVCKP